MAKKQVSIVLPAYNESGNIRFVKERVTACFPFERYDLELIFVNDGSSDDTLEQIKTVARENAYVYFIELSRNFGHQSALKAGLDSANGDCIISMDCDLQHPPEMIPAMLEKWEEGYDVVYTRRLESENLSFLKRKTSNLFYTLFNKFSDVKIEKGTADFRLISRQVANVFSTFTENDIFIRGMIKWIGFKQCSIDYEPSDRFSGVSKYSPKKMMKLAIQGVTSFSVKPLYIAVYLGLILSLLSFLYLPYVLYSFFFSNHYESGWASVLLTIVFFSGLQLSVMGIIGLYLGKMFMQTKNRPQYIIRSSNLNENKNTPQP